MKHLLTALLCLAPLTAEAGFRLCNDTNARVSVALGYKTAAGWTSEGWWEIDSGACKMLLGAPLRKAFYYWSARADGVGFAPGDYEFCTAPSPFTITGDADCAARGHVATRFRQIELPGGTTRHTLVLGPDDTLPVSEDPAPAPIPLAPVAQGRIVDPAAPPPGTYGKPFSVTGLLSHCEVTDAGQQCQIHAEGRRHVVSTHGPTAPAIIDWLADLPENTPLSLTGDLVQADGTYVEITLRAAELTGADRFAAQRTALQGLWTSLDDAAYQMLIFGAVVEELYDRQVTGTSMLDIADSCEGAQGDGPYAILHSYDADEEPQCMSIDRLTDEAMDLWPLGVMKPLRFQRAPGG